MGKLKFTNSELLKSAYCFKCSNEKEKKKGKAYRYAIMDIEKHTDFIEMIKLKRDFKILQYLTLDFEHVKCMPLIGNPNRFEEGFRHENQEFAEIFNPKINIKEMLTLVNSYFDKVEKSGNAKIIDRKLWEIIHPKIKSLLHEMDKSSNKE